MSILNPGSLIETVDNFNEARFFEKNCGNEFDDIVDWISSRLGKSGGYLGSFAMTESDWKREFRLFTGERITTNAGRSHVIAQETTRMLKLIEKEISSSIDVCAVSEQRLSDRIFEDPKSIARTTGDYCCGICSVALWRCVHAGGYKKYSSSFGKGLKTLGAYRQEEGGWRRYPFYYTLLALWEKHDASSLKEIDFHLQICERKMKALKNKTDQYSKRRYELLSRIIANS